MNEVSFEINPPESNKNTLSDYLVCNGFFMSLNSFEQTKKTKTEDQFFKELILIEKSPFVVQDEGNGDSQDLETGESPLESLRDIESLEAGSEDAQLILDWVQGHLQSGDLDQALTRLYIESKSFDRYLDLKINYELNAIEVRMFAHGFNKLRKPGPRPPETISQKEQLGETLDLDYNYNGLFDSYNPVADRLLNDMPLEEISMRSAADLESYLKQANKDGLLSIAVKSINDELSANRKLFLKTNDFGQPEVTLRINDFFQIAIIPM